MRIIFGSICLFVVAIPGLAVHAFAAEGGLVNLVKPIAPPPAIEAVASSANGFTCDKGLVRQKDGHCCPPKTNNDLWQNVCTPTGTIKQQIFNFKGVTQYCPSADMYIVSDKNNKWFSCADSNSTVLYPLPDEPEAYKFCLKHGYGYLIKIQTWKDAGCIKYGESQGDGCIEAGTCSFGK